MAGDAGYHNGVLNTGAREGAMLQNANEKTKGEKLIVEVDSVGKQKLERQGPRERRKEFRAADIGRISAY